jgi:hypothetical protein
VFELPTTKIFGFAGMQSIRPGNETLIGEKDQEIIIER